MSANTDTLQRAYDAFAQGDVQTLQDSWTDDIEWEGPNASELPGGGTHKGKQDVLQMLGEIGNAWDDFSVTPDEWFEKGDTVVVLGHNEARTKSGGQQVKVPFVHVARFSGAKIQRFQTLTDTKVVADALGL